MCKTKECGHCGNIFKVISGRKDFCSKKCYGISRRGIDYDKGVKGCNACLKEKGIDQFHKDGKYSDGSIRYGRNCKKCEIYKTYNKYNDPGLPFPTPALPLDYDYRAKKINGLKKRFQKRKEYLARKKEMEIYLANNVGQVCCMECHSLFESNLEGDKIEPYCRDCRNLSKGMDMRHSQYESTPDCLHCNKPYYREYGAMTTMCRPCVKSADRAYKTIARTRRRTAMLAGSYISVDPIKVFKRDKWRCKMCNVKTHKRNIYADDSAELDHIVPLSKGGNHIPSNLQCLCRRCNAIKSDRLIGQASLFSVPLSG
jgi:5-methylcytosine-specific restriction endonuclease McrA